MKRECLSKHVVSDTSHLDSVWCEKLASIDETSSLEGDWIVALVHDEHANDAFVAINDEVATPFVHVFFTFDQLSLGQAGKAAVFRADHDWDLSDADIDLFWILVVNAPAECRVKRCLVGEGAQAALSWVDGLLL